MSPGQQEVVRIALERASRCLEDTVEDLIRETRGNQYALQRAAHELSEMIETSDSPASIALELVAAAYKRMTGTEIDPASQPPASGDPPVIPRTS